MRSRARILDDAFALAEANSIAYEIPLNLTQYLANEEEFLPWMMALSGIGTIVDNFADEPETQYVRVSYFNTFLAASGLTISTNKSESLRLALCAPLPFVLFFESAIVSCFFIYFLNSLLDCCP